MRKSMPTWAIVDKDDKLFSWKGELGCVWSTAVGTETSVCSAGVVGVQAEKGHDPPEMG